ncbi:envelope stress response membrane protein PspB [Sphingorhabdus sp.]|jgi:phage shock protein B|uniref:envelope stress response membrane protein PspB n=2 Tax=Sphingorhabdus sp. TaxID=1902408 RepID=UPI003BB1BF7C|nr:envelope stress response membrane protein PspB [Sphingomonadales bacterium]MBK9431626.1 envelope stress response membrane protein PspB [Sphingomonadales bacterium]MBL0021831.1 envelope stress response membrane protein PspB [Sphingomonadales bacterium]
MEDILVPIFVCGILFIGLPWLVMHYVTRWKTAPTLTNDDERMLIDMNELARRLEDRLETVERLVASDNPDWQPRRIDHDADEYISENIRRLERKN